MKFFGNFSEIFFWRNYFGGIFWEEFFERIFLEGFLEGFFGRISFRRIFLVRNHFFYFNVEGIDVFVKILSKSRKRKEGGQNLDP